MRGILSTAAAGALLLVAGKAIAAEPVEEIVVTGYQTQAAPSAMHSTIDKDAVSIRGVQNLGSALALTAGVDAPPGGDAGPAGAVPAFWGLQEFDAFLLVVDGVPAGGAFNPAIPTLDFLNIDRIEVTRGAAPVTYGVPSFVGTIEMFHAAPGSTDDVVSVWGGEHERAGFALASDLPAFGKVRHSISVSGEHTKFEQDRSDMDRAHALYRLATKTDWGAVGFDLDLTALRQTPYSPHPREGAGLSPRFVFDANVNPSDAKQDQNRAQATFRLRRDLTAGTDFFFTASYTHTGGENTRGFLRKDFATDGVTVNADGFRQDTVQDEMFLGAHVEADPSDRLKISAGADWNGGRAKQNSANFEYAVRPDGANAPNSHSLPIDEATALTDKRSFAGLYAKANWRPVARLSLDAGVRYNFTKEKRSGRVVDFHAAPGTPPEHSGDRRTKHRVSGQVGATYTLWQSGQDQLSAFAGYSNTYKPAAIDLGPEAEGDILKPETSGAWQAGLRGQAFDGKLGWEASYFDMHIKNLIIRENAEGLPALANAGEERFRGVEVEGHYRPADWLDLMASYAHHKAEFVDYARLHNTSLQQLAGRQLELSPNHIAGLGVIAGAEEGWRGSVVAHYVGARFLNKTNTVEADGYTTLNASLGYRTSKWEALLRAQNITDRRDPVAESELGDAQFYTLPGRVVWLRLTRHL